MKRVLNKRFLIISIVIGIILGILEELIYKSVVYKFYGRISCITVYLSLFALIVGLVLLIKGAIDDAHKDFGKAILFTLLTIIVFVGCTALFEYLYELGGDKPKKLDADDIQYAFLIDDSGSMLGNDPDSKRYEAVEDIIRNLTPTKNFCVYRFADYSVCETNIGDEDSNKYKFSNSNENVGGGTRIMSTIINVIKDVSKRKVHTKIIILTDGSATDNFFSKDNRAINKAVKNNTSISSVGFGAPDEAELKKLADNTGGTYVFSDNISGLTDNLETVVNAQTTPLNTNRDLLGYRFDSTSDSFWYGFLRVLFLILLGILWSIIKLLLIGDRKCTRVSSISSVVLCTLAAILCEVLFAVGFGGWLVRILFCAMWSCTVIQDLIQSGVQVHGSIYSDYQQDILNPKSIDSKSQEVGDPKSLTR